MIFKGEPKQRIYDLAKRKAYRFDENGLFETEDKRLIRKFRTRFEVWEEPQKEPQAEVKKVQTHTCKYCGAEFDNIGKMLAHIRKEHKGEGNKDES